MRAAFRSLSRERRLALVVALTLGAFAAVWLALAFLRSASAPDAPTPTERAIAAENIGPSRVDYARLDQRIAELMRQRDMVGLAVGTVENGNIRFLKGYGETTAGSGNRVTPDTVFRWASLSKSVAAALVVKLAEDGKGRLDTPVAGLGTTLTLPGDWSRVTVADVLSHRLGIVHNAWDDRLEAGADPRQIRAELHTLPQYCPPATCYSYQNVAYDTASEIVERWSGERYGAAARTRLFAPLGMANATVGRTGLEKSASWARPHRAGRRPVAVEEAYYRVPAAGGVNSSIFDLTRWMQAQMGRAPNTLSASTLQLMHTPRVKTPPNGPRGPMDRALKDASYGLGWRSFDYRGHALVGHRGSVDGYGSLILFDPTERSGIVMLWNSNHYPAARLQLEFFDLLYGLPRTDWLDLPPAGRRAAGR